jgi:hypothetical protein
VDATRARLLRDLLSGSPWVPRIEGFARTMARVTRRPSGLLIVGTPADEPWHLTAHLSDEAALAGSAELTPTLVRWRPPPGAPPHLSVSLDRLAAARRGETLLVVAPGPSPDPLLERVADVRRYGATVLALDGGDPALEELAHDALVVPPPPPPAPPTRDAGTGETAPDFDTVEHLVSLAVGEGAGRPRGLRGRLARLLDVISGPDLRHEVD